MYDGQPDEETTTQASTQPLAERKFRIVVRETNIYVTFVTAEDVDEARDIARQLAGQDHMPWESSTVKYAAKEWAR